MTRLEPSFICSRCKLGKNRVFYVVWKWGDWFERREPLASGYRTTIQEAESIMSQVATCPENQISRAAGYAHFYHRKLTEEKRRQRPASREQGSTAVEFVYGDFYNSDDSKSYAIPHRIIRRTRQRVFVNMVSYRDGKDFWTGRAYSLSRTQLDRTGSTWSRVARTKFYASIEAFNRDHRFSAPIAKPPNCLAFFGLELPTTLESLKAVNRDRVKQTHPDHGGSPDDFRQVQLQYQTALTFLERHQGATR